MTIRSPNFSISIHAPVRGATGYIGNDLTLLAVSIHAPRAGRDRVRGQSPRRTRRFNPRAPCGARPFSCPACRSRCCFNPHAPCGARRAHRHDHAWRHKFQSTRPMRSATWRYPEGGAPDWFQSTRPMRGATQSRCGYFLFPPFQSTRPVRGATRDVGVLQCT